MNFFQVNNINESSVARRMNIFQDFFEESKKKLILLFNGNSIHVRKRRFRGFMGCCITMIGHIKYVFFFEIRPIGTFHSPYLIDYLTKNLGLT